MRAEKRRAELNRESSAEESRAEGGHRRGGRAEQSRGEQSRGEQSRAEDRREEESRAEIERAEQRRADQIVTSGLLTARGLPLLAQAHGKTSFTEHRYTAMQPTELFKNVLKATICGTWGSEEKMGSCTARPKWRNFAVHLLMFSRVGGGGI